MEMNLYDLQIICELFFSLCTIIFGTFCTADGITWHDLCGTDDFIHSSQITEIDFGGGLIQPLEGRHDA